MNPTDPSFDFPARGKKPVILVITAAFLAFVSLIPLPKLLSQPVEQNCWIAIVVISSFIALAMLLTMGRSRVVFYVTRWVLSVWLFLAIAAFYERCLVACGVAKTPVDPMETVNAIMLGVGAVLMALLFIYHGFGKASRGYYGVGDYDVALAPRG